MQQAFAELDAFQCGYCTPGQLLSAVACIAEGHAADDASVREWMSGNICRCSAYPQITAAVLAAAREERAGEGLRLRPGRARPNRRWRALADPGTSVIAGGTELLNWFRLGIAAADRVVDIGGLDELRGIASDGDDLRIGALATLNEIGEHPLVAQRGRRAGLGVPAGRLGADTEPGHDRRQRAAAHPLPVFPRRGTACRGRATSAIRAAAAPSLAGRHERQAIFGWTQDCVAVQPSDPAVALAMLDAEADVSGPAGPRAIPMRGVPPDPARSGRGRPADARDPARTRRADHRLPLPVERRRRRPTSRSASGRPTSTRSCPPRRPCDSTGRLITAARVALGSVAQRPWRLTLAEAELPGIPLTREALLPGHRAGDGRRRAPAAERVQGDDGEQRRGARPAHGGRCP